jgi:signal transduction histidine kinase
VDHPKDTRLGLNWLDMVWLGVLTSLALLPPLDDNHKYFILLAIALLQLSERWILAQIPRHGRYYVVLLKIALATLLLDHTALNDAQPAISSSYYPVYYLPVVTAAIYFGPLGTLFWTALSAAAYCSYLIPAIQEFELTPAGVAELLTRISFFFLAGMVVNRFVVENRQQMELYQKLATELAETNRRLERIQAEARRSERLAALGQLSAGLAHEIRNPLGVIKGSAEMLTKKLQAADPLSSELAGYISGEVNRLSALVSRFLDFARPLHAETRSMDVTMLLDRALKTVTEHWRNGASQIGEESPRRVAPAINVERQYPEPHSMVPLDENLCEQAFTNMVQNACEAMGADGGTLRVEVSPASRNGRRGVEVSVQDSGPGIPPELREQIFNPFVTTKKTGVGLGLSIVSKIMDEHQGSIRVVDGNEHGACFVLFFPAEEQNKDKMSS